VFNRRRHQEQSDHGFAVVDVETTGLFPHRDRIVEVAIVTMDERLAVQDEFVTLINPHRDVGRTRLHGITAADVADAPTFEDAAADVAMRLLGRVFVGHNVEFDLTMVESEFGRLSWQMPAVPTLCTMRLASAYLSGLTRTTLEACCDAASVQTGMAHTALADAVASANLLQCYAQSHTTLPQSWQSELRYATELVWPPVPPAHHFAAVTREAERRSRASADSPLSDLLHILPHGPIAPFQPYLALLARALEDRLIEPGEVETLTDLVREHGMSNEQVRAAHTEYLTQVATAALVDGTVTDDEQADLLEVGRLLGINGGELDVVLASAAERSNAGDGGPAPGTGLQAGDKVVFTGEMSVPREQLVEHAESLGLRVMNSVSGKTSLLVIADPHSQSGKARAAREKGVRIVTEQVFDQLCLGIEKQTATAAP